jgi:RimJ/RimL family protein N-acetyltransferase
VVDVRIEPWDDGDLPLLERIMGDPVMTMHLGGPEPRDKIVERQARYERLTASGPGCMFKIVVDGARAGSVGYWEREWRGVDVYEIGWMVLPEFQGRGVAKAATALAIDAARAAGEHQFLHAYPKVENAPSNAICEKLGFELLGVTDFEYPKGNPIRCNDWRLDLR